MKYITFKGTCRYLYMNTEYLVVVFFFFFKSRDDIQQSEVNWI